MRRNDVAINRFRRARAGNDLTPLAASGGLICARKGCKVTADDVRRHCGRADVQCAQCFFAAIRKGRLAWSCGRWRGRSRNLRV